jgi:hypothetical protein
MNPIVYNKSNFPIRMARKDLKEPTFVYISKLAVTNLENWNSNFPIPAPIEAQYLKQPLANGCADLMAQKSLSVPSK